MTIIASLELGRYGVRANCIGPGGFTRMVGVAMQDIVVRNPEEYEDVRRHEPGQLGARRRVARVRRLEAGHRPGAARGRQLARVYKPWEMGEEFFSKDKEGNPTQWDPAEIGPTLHKYVFNTINPGIARIQRG